MEVWAEGALRRAVEVSAPEWRYGAGQIAADGLAGTSVEVRVAQVSDRVGPGVFARRVIDV